MQHCHFPFCGPWESPDLGLNPSQCKNSAYFPFWLCQLCPLGPLWSCFLHHVYFTLSPSHSVLLRLSLGFLLHPLSSQSSCCCFCLECSPSCSPTSIYLDNSYSTLCLREDFLDISNLTQALCYELLISRCSITFITPVECCFVFVLPGPVSVHHTVLRSQHNRKSITICRIEISCPNGLVYIFHMSVYHMLDIHSQSVRKQSWTRQAKSLLSSVL